MITAESGRVLDTLLSIDMRLCVQWCCSTRKARYSRARGAWQPYPSTCSAASALTVPDNLSACSLRCSGSYRFAVVSSTWCSAGTCLLLPSNLVTPCVSPMPSPLTNYSSTYVLQRLWVSIEHRACPCTACMLQNPVPRASGQRCCRSPTV